MPSPLLGIDYGRKRIGIAVSDPDALIATALTTIVTSSMREAINQLVVIIDRERPGEIVIGYPLHADGRASEMSDAVDRFIERLGERLHEQFGSAGDIPITRSDEFVSSQEAEAVLHAHGKRIKGNKEKIDRLAAAILLQRYLDQRRGGV